MTTRMSSGYVDQAANVDAQFVTRVLEQMGKIDEISHSTNELRVDISLIKARLFNGLMDTIRETYSQVLILDNKQKDIDTRLEEFQMTWVSKFTAHDVKEKVFHVLIGGVMVLTMCVFSVILVLQLEERNIIERRSPAAQRTENVAPLPDGNLRLVVPQ